MMGEEWCMYGFQLSWPPSHGKQGEEETLTQLFIVARHGLFHLEFWNTSSRPSKDR